MATVVKICGNTTLADSLAAVEAGADLLGFIFHPASRRHVRWEEASRWLPELRGRAVRVGVFVDAPQDLVRQALESGHLDLVQLHGSESPEFCASFGDRAMKALRIRSRADLELIDTHPGRRLLLDAPEPGSGRVFDWSLARDAVLAHPTRQIMLAGGLNPENVADAIAAVRPWGVDVATGVESAPGRKDAGRLTAFIQAVKAAGRTL